MAILSFPSIEQADENGLLAFGGDLEVASLSLAYRSGIFPWPINKRYPLAWFSPDPRGILELKNLHLPRSLKKSMRQLPWKITFNRCFNQVIQKCADIKNRGTQQEEQGTWITQEIIQGYCDFHLAGHAFSVEVWLEEKLVGGLYGVRTGRALSGESMFHTQNDASKIALYSLMKFLQRNNIHWLDTQMVTSVVSNLGGQEIARKKFIKMLDQTKNLDGDQLFDSSLIYSAIDFVT